MLYIIGLGLDEESVSVKGLEAIRKCKEVYLENYTVEFPYSIEKLEKAIGKKLFQADRNLVESFGILDKAKNKTVALLVYGSPLTATTHISLIEESEKRKIKCELIYNASVFDAVGETGLQIYKFGKVTSIPNFKADSFLEVIKENQKINAHSLILIDIGMKFTDALERMEKFLGKNKIVVCSRLGTNESRIFYGTIENLINEDVKAPFCFIVPGKMHFVEEEVLKRFE
jgi:diphthine synthase